MRQPERIPSDPVTADRFRRALGQFATGVTVVTGVDPATGHPEGMTVNAFTSLSLEPPLVLICLDRQARLASVFESAQHFAVNVLSVEQRHLSVAFSTTDGNRFRNVAWHAWARGVPILEGCVANLECVRTGCHDGGDHVIVVGQVERLLVDENCEPLLFARGSYRGLGGMAP
ncbi:MAG: flavin reductase family protein [Alphaproteobacteria bacterium]|nr:flavin reductase family protein [Alphaproteobacteria bacterium]MBM3733442.1 flavin reductase family protein [Acidimicrobiia bacterium]